MTDEGDMRGLIALAKRMPHTESARRDAASFANFEARLEQRRAPRSRRRALWACSALVTCAAVTLAWPALRARLGNTNDAELRYVLAPISGQAEPELTQELAFSDGSRVQLASESQASVAQVTRRGARVVLGNGRAEVSIKRRKDAAWQLVAGPYTVRVTGTAFRLAWSRERQELEVSMRHGSVVVTGPLAEQGVTLKAGQRLLGSPGARRLLVEQWSQGREPVLAAREQVAPAVALSASAPEAHPNAERARVRGDHGWAKHVAQGDSARVLEEARTLGLSRVLSGASASDLAALADAARYARKEALGQKALLALRERFPASEHARDAAFLLGRLSKNRSALVWYQRYLAEQPGGAYESQALGRGMMLCFELADSACAERLAQNYLTRFPSGPYAAAARKLSARPATP